MNPTVGSTEIVTRKFIRKLATATGYILVCISIAAAWSVREQNLIRAEDGIGYALGIVGASLMLLLLVYPLRKRVRSLASLGSVRFWFRTHMLFGILGPMLILFHSNFVLGSLNGKVALICTLVVASSGIIGRHLYAKIHHGMYGERATLASLRAEVGAESSSVTGPAPWLATIDEQLLPHERRVLERSKRVLPSLSDALFAPFVVRRLKSRLERSIRAEVVAATLPQGASAADRDRLEATVNLALARRLGTYRKLAQLRGCERLFSLWHVVHFPLFLVMVVAAIVHVIAVHAY